MSDDLAAVFPLGTAYLPGDVVSLRVFEPRYQQMVSELSAWNDQFVSVLISEGSEVGGRDRRFDVGVRVEDVHVTSDGVTIMIQGRATDVMAIIEWLPDNPYPLARVAPQLVADTLTNGTNRDERVLQDVASRLSRVAQRSKTLRSMMMRAVAPDSQVEQDVDGEEPLVINADERLTLGMIASGQWTQRRVSIDELWAVYWTVCRSVPCGSLDRYGFLSSGSLESRIERLEVTVEHVTEIVRFRFG